MKQTYEAPEATVWYWQTNDIITVSAVTLYDAEGNPITDSFMDIEALYGN